MLTLLIFPPPPAAPGDRGQVEQTSTHAEPVYGSHEPASC